MLLPIITIIFIVLVLLFGVVSLLKNIKNRYLLFSALSFNIGMSVWQISLIVIGRIADGDFLHRIAFTAIIWGIIGAIGLALLYPNIVAKEKIKILIKICFLISIIFSIFLLFTDLIISGYLFDSRTVLFTPTGYIYIYLIPISILFIPLIFVVRYLKEPQSRFYFKYISFFFVISAIILIFTNYLLPFLGNMKLNEYGSLVAIVPQLGIIYTLGFGYINKLSYIVFRAIRGLLIVLSNGGFFYIGLLVYEKTFKGELSAEFITFLMIYLLSVYIVYARVKHFINGVSEKFGFIGGISPELARNEYARLISKKISLNDTVLATKNFLKNFFEVEKVEMIVWNEKMILIYTDIETKTYADDVKKLFLSRKRDVKDGRNILNVISLPQKERKKYENTYGTIAFIPPGYGFFAAIIFGNKYNFEPFTNQDITALQGIIELISTSFNRSVLNEQVEKFNESLKYKIKLATKRLDEQLIELQAARKREQDMMDIMGHELRTPLSIIRISLGLLDQKLRKSKNISKDIDRYMERMDEALQREVRLLESMLNSTKLEADKMELHLEKVKIDEVIKDSVLALGGKASRKGLKIEYRPQSRDLLAFVDRVRVAEVVDNLLLNSIKYTEKGGVSIDVENEENAVRVSIKDTGIGIPKEDIPYLGEKFYRVGQYSNDKKDRVKRERLESEQINLVRPGGTGLGLYVSFNLISLMGGKIMVESKVGKGSTFSFTVPKYSGQAETYSGRNENKNIFKRLGFTRKKS